MTATTVGVDWGMAALGINVTPRKAREPGVRAVGMTARYGAHPAVSTVSVDVQGLGVVSVDRPIRMSTSTTIGTAPRLGQPSTGSVELPGCVTEQWIDGLVSVGTVAPSPANDRHVYGSDFRKSLIHLRPSISNVPDFQSSTVNLAFVHCDDVIDVLHVTRTTRDGFSSPSAIAPPVRHMCAARMPADVS